MNYAKLVGSTLQLFPKKVKVTLIDAATGKDLGRYKILAGQLPTAFNKPTMLEINNTNWRVLKAVPLLADDFLFKKKLTLHVMEAVFANTDQGLFNSPTICDKQPVIDNESLYNGFTLNLAPNDWRQLEFLSLEHWETIEEEIKEVENILGSQPNPLLGYNQQYRRVKTASAALDIPFQTFCSLVADPELGSICLGHGSIIQQGFALQTENYLYYGTLRENSIQTLSITQFDGVDDELMQVLDTFKLVLVDWCNASTLSAELGETPKSEFVNI